jgi:hypothetical protein
MPITQDRLISIVEASGAILQGYDVLSRNAKRIDTCIAELNSLMTKVDARYRATLLTAIDMLRDQYNVVIDMSIYGSDLRALIATEREHFRRFGKRNVRMAEYRRTRRKKDISQDFNSEREGGQNDPAAAALAEAKAEGRREYTEEEIARWQNKAIPASQASPDLRRMTQGPSQAKAETEPKPEPKPEPEPKPKPEVYDEDNTRNVLDSDDDAIGPRS